MIPFNSLEVLIYSHIKGFLLEKSEVIWVYIVKL